MTNTDSILNILDGLSELVYITDMETYDLLYINDAGKRMFNIPASAVPPYGLCHQLLQGNEEPCDFCTNPIIRKDIYYTWEKTNAVTGRHFMLKDKIIQWEGKERRIEIAFDVTDDKETERILKRLTNREGIKDTLGLARPHTLNRMLEDGQFPVFYQPQFSLREEVAVGAEALIRCVDNDGNFYSPAQFIPLLEEARLISKLDHYVFAHVCEMLAKWREEGRKILPVSCNFSRHTISETDFTERLNRVLKRYDIPRDMVELEVTETVAADDEEWFDNIVQELYDSGFRISIDDFGVSNANMAILTDLEFHVLKIDKHMIDSVCLKEKTRLLCEALVDVCKRLNIRTIAEGVEIKEQMETLRAMHCDVAQGYYFSKPLPEWEFVEKYLPEGA